MKEVNAILASFAEDIDVSHLELLREFNFINNFSYWFESLDTDGSEEAKEEIRKIVKCFETLYGKAFQDGSISDDTELTAGTVLFSAQHCIDSEILVNMIEFL